jgi:hypothetical protein
MRYNEEFKHLNANLLLLAARGRFIDLDAGRRRTSTLPASPR